jgi:hypothetical protein
MQYLNIQLTGLSGRSHPALLNINTTQDSKKLRLHLKFLTGDYQTGWRRSRDLPGTDPACRLCMAPTENTEHILATCPALAEERQRMFPDLMNPVADVQPSCKILQTHTPTIFAQFILDCTSINLADDYLIPANNLINQDIFALARDWCFAVSNSRARQIKALELGRSK